MHWSQSLPRKMLRRIPDHDLSAYLRSAEKRRLSTRHPPYLISHHEMNLTNFLYQNHEAIPLFPTSTDFAVCQRRKQDRLELMTKLVCFIHEIPSIPPCSMMRIRRNVLLLVSAIIFSYHCWIMSFCVFGFAFLARLLSNCTVLFSCVVFTARCNTAFVLRDTFVAILHALVTARPDAFACDCHLTGFVL